MAEKKGRTFTSSSAKKQSFFPSSRCHCAARESVHVHCPCQICKGKAVNPKTQQKHLLFLNQCETIEAEVKQDREIEVEMSAGKFIYRRHFLALWIWLNVTKFKLCDMNLNVI